MEVSGRVINNIHDRNLCFRYWYRCSEHFCFMCQEDKSIINLLLLIRWTVCFVSLWSKTQLVFILVWSVSKKGKRKIRSYTILYIFKAQFKTPPYTLFPSCFHHKFIFRWWDLDDTEMIFVKVGKPLKPSVTSPPTYHQPVPVFPLPTASNSFSFSIASSSSHGYT